MTKTTGLRRDSFVPRARGSRKSSITTATPSTCSAGSSAEARRGSTSTARRNASSGIPVGSGNCWGSRAFAREKAWAAFSSPTDGDAPPPRPRGARTGGRDGRWCARHRDRSAHRAQAAPPRLVVCPSLKRTGPRRRSRDRAHHRPWSPPRTRKSALEVVLVEEGLALQVVDLGLQHAIRPGQPGATREQLVREPKVVPNDAELLDQQLDPVQVGGGELAVAIETRSAPRRSDRRPRGSHRARCGPRPASGERGSSFVEPGESSWIRPPWEASIAWSRQSQYRSLSLRMRLCGRSSTGSCCWDRAGRTDCAPIRLRGPRGVHPRAPAAVNGSRSVAAAAAVRPTLGFTAPTGSALAGLAPQERGRRARGGGDDEATAPTRSGWPLAWPRG